MDNKVNVRIKLEQGVDVPCGLYPEDTKYDITSNEDFTILAGESHTVKTGFCVDVPDGYEMQIRSLYSLASKNSVIVLNAPGSVDHTCKSEVKVLLFNLSKNNWGFKKGEKIAYIVFTPVCKAEFVVVDTPTL